MTFFQFICIVSLVVFIIKLKDRLSRRLIIEEREEGRGFKSYRIIITGFNSSYVEYLNNKGYLSELITILKEDNKICYYLTYDSNPKNGSIEHVNCKLVNNKTNIKKIINTHYKSYSGLCFIISDDLDNNIDFKFTHSDCYIDSLADINGVTDAVVLNIGCCSAEEDFLLYSKRLNGEQVKTIISNSVNNKIKMVIAK